MTLLQIVNNVAKWIRFLGRETESVSNVGILKKQEAYRGTHMGLIPLVIVTLLLAILLPTSVANATQSGTWTGTSNTSPGGGNTTAGTGDGLVGIAEVTTTANSGAFTTRAGFMGTLNAYSEPTITLAPSLEARFQWGGPSGPGTATVTFTFDRPVTNPVLHIDKLGGSSRPGNGNYISNSALLTLDTSTGLSLTPLSGVGHFNIDESNNTIWRTLNDILSTSVQFECRTNATGASGGTACGSVRVNGTTSSVTFTLSQLADPGTTGYNDYMEFAWTFDQDLGDAPQIGTSYGGAVHNILEAADGTPLLYLGTVGPDDENDSQPTPAANGDDNDGNDDEDGVVLSYSAGKITAMVTVTNNTGNAARVCGYLDGGVGAAGGTLNVNGAFERGAIVGSLEERCFEVAANSGSATEMVSWYFPAPTSVNTTTYARFRVSTDADFLSNRSPSPTGALTDGEVEDYQVVVNPTSATISDFDATMEGVDGFISELSNSGALLVIPIQLWLGRGSIGRGYRRDQGSFE